MTLSKLENEVETEMGHKTDNLGYKTDKKRKPTKLDTKVETKMGHQQN